MSKNINIELTELQEHFLKLFAKNQYPGAKDNVCTNKPIHAVQTQRETITKEGYNHDKTVIVVPDWDNMEFETPEDLVKEYYVENMCPIPVVSYETAYNTDVFIDVDGDETYISDWDDYLVAYGIEEDLYEIHAIKIEYEDVAYFYTLQSAKEYIQYQGHNLTNPRTYTKSGGYGNKGEYEHFWDLLMSIGKKLNEK